MREQQGEGMEMQGMPEKYFTLWALKDFGWRQTCPKNFWKNLVIRHNRADPCRMPLALTLDKMGCTSAIEASFIAFGLHHLCKGKIRSTCSGTFGRIKWLWNIRIPLWNIASERQKKMKTRPIPCSNLCCHHWWGRLPLYAEWNRGERRSVKGERMGGCFVATKTSTSDTLKSIH